MAAKKRPAKKSTASKRTASKRSAASKPVEVGPYASSDDVRTALIAGTTFGAKPVQYSVVDGDCVFEGDIDLGTVDEVAAQSAQLAAEVRGDTTFGVVITGANHRWTNCVIPYTIDPALTNQARVTDAIAHWETNTDYNFVLRTSANQAQHPDYVTFRPHATRCSSPVGRRGNQQFVNLASGCGMSTVIHEIGHVVGLWHEQSREDRDAFVTINWDKIKDGREHNFNQHISDGDDVGPYDYGSIMHYPRTAFTTDGSETITPTDPAAVIGQRAGLSAGDIATANSLCTPVKITKEFVTETRKELVAETRKEFVTETIKERFPETRKEFIPETRKELIEPTRVESIRPGIVDPIRPGVWPGRIIGRLPFAMQTPQHATTGPEPASPTAELEAEVDAVAEAVQVAEAELDALSEHYDGLIAQLQQMGWQ